MTDRGAVAPPVPEALGRHRWRIDAGIASRPLDGAGVRHGDPAPAFVAMPSSASIRTFDLIMRRIRKSVRDKTVFPISLRRVDADWARVRIDKHPFAGSLWVQGAAARARGANWIPLGRRSVARPCSSRRQRSAGRSRIECHTSPVSSSHRRVAANYGNGELAADAARLPMPDVAK